MAALLNPGDGIVDNVPFFPGLTGLQISAAIDEHVKEKTDFRILDANDREAISDGKVERPVRSGLNLTRIRSILDDKGKQGTDWKFAPNTRGIVEIDQETPLTTFLQSLLRYRQLGKGQEALILYNPLTLNLAAMPKQWRDKLKEKSCFTHLAVSLICQEAKSLKPLNTEANVKDIKSIYEAGIQKMCQEMQSRDSLIWLATRPEASLTKDCPLDPEVFGAPIELENGRKQLETLRDTYSAKAKAFLKAIKASSLEEGDKQIALQALREVRKQLREPSLILDGKYLSENRSKHHFDSNASEEIQVEEQAQVEVHQALAMEMTGDLGIEVQVDEEIVNGFKSGIQPSCNDAELYTVKSFPFKPCLKNEVDKYDRSTFPIDPKLFPSIWASANTLGFDGKKGDISASKLSLEDLTPNFWWTEKCEKQAAIGPKAFLVMDTYFKKLGCLLFTVNEMDHFGHRILLKKLYGKTLGYPSLNGNTNNTMIFKIDLRDPRLPAILEEHELRKEAVRSLAFAKIAYLEGRFSEEEKEVIKEWLLHHKALVPFLYRRLTNYLELYYPNIQSHPLQQLMKEFLEGRL